jgi:hypothetical protein
MCKETINDGDLIACHRHALTESNTEADAEKLAQDGRGRLGFGGWGRAAYALGAREDEGDIRVRSGDWRRQVGIGAG